MGNDEVNKQYLKLSTIISFVISFIINFFLFGLINGPILGGFPINISDSSGASEIFGRFINTLIMGILLIVPIFYFFQWIQKRSNGGY